LLFIIVATPIYKLKEYRHFLLAQSLLYLVHVCTGTHNHEFDNYGVLFEAYGSVKEVVWTCESIATFFVG